MLRVEDELAAAIDAWMAGDLIRAADDRDLVDETFYEDVTKAIGGGHRIIVHAVTHERGRGDFVRTLVAVLERRLGQRAQNHSIRNEPFTNRLFVAAGAFILTRTAALF